MRVLATAATIGTVLSAYAGAWLLALAALVAALAVSEIEHG